MTTYLRAKIVTVAVVAGILSCGIANAADLDRNTVYFKKHRRLASLDYVYVSPGECRTGWWQTLRYGHVRPLWATRCR